MIQALGIRAAPAPGLAAIDSLRTKDHASFVTQLAEIHRAGGHMSESDARYLTFLDGWEANYEGRYAEAETAFREVMASDSDDALGTRATALLMNNLTGRGKYAEAYAMVPRAQDALTAISDPDARFAMLANLAQMLSFAGQPQQALEYAEMMVAATPAGTSACPAMAQRVIALDGARRISSGSPELKVAIDQCAGDRQPVFADAVALIRIDRLLDERKPAEALKALTALSAAIQASRYFPHLIDLASQRAKAYEQLGNVAEARKSALETLAMKHAGDVSEGLRSAYAVLYRIEKATGDTASALSYYEQYVVQDQGYLRDANVRNAAYEAASQHFRAEKLETDGLAKENRILRLQQALDANAVETSRLYIVLLALVLVSTVFWLVRIKRSQLRFKWLSACDGLTGIFNHQHFMGECERLLGALEKRSGDGCLVFLDLDHFKQVNDTYGHATGDALLKHVVAICKSQLRDDDVLGRLGGEEFGMLLLDAPRLQGRVVAERLRVALATSPLMADGLNVSVSVSIGLACTDTCGYDVRVLCRASDAALYQAKRNGRNRVVVDGDERALLFQQADA